MPRRTPKIHFSLASVDIVDFKCLTLASSKVDVCGNSKFTTAIIRIYWPPNAIKKKTLSQVYSNRIIIILTVRLYILLLTNEKKYLNEFHRQHWVSLFRLLYPLRLSINNQFTVDIYFEDSLERNKCICLRLISFFFIMQSK